MSNNNNNAPNGMSYPTVQAPLAGNPNELLHKV